MNNKEKARALIEEARSIDAEARRMVLDPSVSGARKIERLGIAQAAVEQRLERAQSLSAADAAEIDEVRDDALGFMADGKRDAEIQLLTAGERGGLTTMRADAEEGEWRAILPSLDEYRATITTGSGSAGPTVPSGVASRVVDQLRARSVFLRGIPGANLIPYSEKNFTLPLLDSSSDPGYVAEGATITDGDAVFTGLSFTSIKLADLRWVSNELLADSAVDLRTVLGDDMVRKMGTKFDADAFTGSGSTHLTGLIGQGTSNDAAGAAVTYDDIADMVANLEAAEAVASVVWAAPDVAANLRKEKATGSGNYLGGAPVDGPAATAWGLPLLVSSHITAGTAVVADGSRIFAGTRSDLRIVISEDARFEDDVVGYRITARFGGIAVAEATSVQVVAPAA